MTTVETFLFGVAGGVLPEFYVFYTLRHTWLKEKPSWVKSPFYWLMTFVMVLLGGGTAALYSYLGIKLNALMAMHLGIATPVLIQTALKEKPKIN
ncbi:hypothetical protein [Marinobacterium stanieri]|uniref:hypothetical protein n=1 Tax=Marinobacterium stanieri TaxID=49186 RepID=UPI0002558F1A|nr:hypothetical protein [Marinobacterium stanieri]